LRLRSCTAETLTAMRGAFSPCCCHLRCTRVAAASICLPASKIIPVCSRIGTNFTGGTSSPSGPFQRISASRPMIERVAMSTFGW